MSDRVRTGALVSQPGRYCLRCVSRSGTRPGARTVALTSTLLTAGWTSTTWIPASASSASGTARATSRAWCPSARWPPSTWTTTCGGHARASGLRRRSVLCGSSARGRGWPRTACARRRASTSLPWASAARHAARLRHACATHLLEHQADLRHIQELLGHASVESTQIYTHVNIKHLKATVARCHPRERTALPDGEGAR